MPAAEQEFVQRLLAALERAPGVPEKSHGRMTRLMREIQRHSGEHLTLESVRRWFSGRNRPQGANLEALCKVLQCDPAWLIFGSNSGGTRLEPARGSVRANGAVYFCLGRMLLDGLAAALPVDGDELARAGAIDLEAIVGHQARRFTVSQAEQLVGAGDQAPGRLIARARMPSVGNEHLIVLPRTSGQHAVFHLPGTIARQVVEPRLDHGEIRFRVLKPGRIGVERALASGNSSGDLVQISELQSFAGIGAL